MAVKAGLSETHLDANKIKGLRKILQVSRTVKTNEWVLNKVGVKRELIDTKQGS